MEPSDSGRHCGKCSRPRENSAAGSIRRPTCWTTCQSGCSPRPRRSSIKIWMAPTKVDAGKASTFRGDLRGQISQGDWMPLEGSRRVVDLLRLPGRTLDPLAHDQSDREHVRDGPPAASAHQGERFSHGLPDDGLQADAVGVQEMAAAKQYAAHARSDRRSSVHRRNQTPSNRRLKNFPSTTSCNISREHVPLPYNLPLLDGEYDNLATHYWVYIEALLRNDDSLVLTWFRVRPEGRDPRSLCSPAARHLPADPYG